jgi:dynein heavy chain
MKSPFQQKIQQKQIFNKLLLQQNYHVLTLGPTGTGKSLNNSELLTTGLTDTYQYISFSFFSSNRSQSNTRYYRQQNVKRRKGYYGPPIGKKCIIFIDD